MLVSGVQQSDSFIYKYNIYVFVSMYINIFFFRFFSIIVYYKILNIVHCATE